MPVNRPLASAEALSAVLPPLLVRAERAAATIVQGHHGRRQAGPGEAFWQFRRYQPGDALTTVDWRQTGKADHAFVREREWAAAQTVTLWCAGGPGMDWQSAPSLPTKRDRGALLLLALACLLVQGGERVSLLGAPPGPSHGRAALEHMAQVLTGESPDTLSADIAVKRGTVVLIGDWLGPLAETTALVQRLSAAGNSGQVVHIIDPAEEDFPYSGRVRFTLPGNSKTEWLAERAEDIRPQVAAHLAAHRQSLEHMATTAGWGFLSHRSDQPPSTALLSLYHALSREWRR